MSDATDELPDDLASAHAMILAERAARRDRRSRCGQRQGGELAFRCADRPAESNRWNCSSKSWKLTPARTNWRRRLAAKSSTVRAFERKRPSRKPFPEHLPRERVVIAAPTSCPCCGSMKLSKLGEDMTETLEVIPRSVEGDPDGAGEVYLPGMREDHAAAGTLPRHAAGLRRPEPARHDPVREVRSASTAQPPERALRPGRHRPQPSRRWPTRSALATVALKPLHELIARHVLAAERLHADDTTVPILAKGKTDTGRIWSYVRDDRPFGGADPPAALYYASRDRRHEHPDDHLKGFGAFCRPMPMAATTASTIRHARQEW
jgi:transposase